MRKQHYLPSGTNERGVWLSNFSTKLPDHATTLGVDAATVTSVQNDAQFYLFIVTSHSAYKEKGKEWTAYKNLMSEGGPGDGAVPAAPGLGTVPTLVLPGIFDRVRALVRQIKSAGGYTEAIGQDLGVIGSDLVVDFANMKPTLTYHLDAGHPVIEWKKGLADGLKIFVNRDGSGFQYLDMDKRPNYKDTHTLPDVGTSTIWMYKAIYVTGDFEETGQFSDELAVTVAGTV